MSIKRFSCYQFTNKDDIPFSRKEYSKFKFGCKTGARKFGTQLAISFMQSSYFHEIMVDLKARKNKLIVLSSPYVHIPTATFAMKDYFVRELNNVLVDNGLNPVLESKIFRTALYKDDYGEMSKEERMKIMKGDSFYCDFNFLKGNNCLFLDDIIITGSHEYGMDKMLTENDPNNEINRYFLYFGQLINEKTDPTIENYLNYYYVHDLLSLDKVIKNDEFLLNTRAVKYILIYNHDECVSFLNYQKLIFLETLYNSAIGNSYHLIPEYQKNLSYLKQLIKNYR